MQRIRHLVAIGMAVALVGACGGHRDAETPRSIGMEPLTSLPAESLVDWVSYADAVIIAEVTSETIDDPMAEDVSAGEGTIERSVEMSIVHTIWTRDGAPTAPASFEFHAPGWAFKGSDRTPMKIAGEDRLEVDGQYLMSVVQWTPGDGIDSWAPMVGAVFRWTGTGVEGDRAESDSPAEAIADKSAAQVSDLLEQTAPDPVSLRYRELDAVARYEAVVAAADPDIPDVPEP